ncbi:MAG: GNAT family N-acetyltransferase, partial [Acidobacteriota bacterium]|nr:GNAT family N-acetyltransferase [Acidobacteriota bacterium]
MVVGIEPTAQGLGLGRALLAPILEEARRDRLPCYLETAQPNNVPFYEHLGSTCFATSSTRVAGFACARSGWTLNLTDCAEEGRRAADHWRWVGGPVRP